MLSSILRFFFRIAIFGYGTLLLWFLLSLLIGLLLHLLAYLTGNCRAVGYDGFKWFGIGIILSNYIAPLSSIYIIQRIEKRSKRKRKP